MASETEEAKAPAAAEATPAAGSGGTVSPMIFYIALGASWLIMLGGGFALVQFVLPGKVAEALKQSPAVEAPAHSEKEGEEGSGAKAEEKSAEKGKEEAKKEGEGEKKKDEKGGHGEGGDKAENAEPPKPKEFVLSEIVVNVAGSRGARYIKASVYFDATPDVLAELERQRARVIDLVSTALANKTMDELTAPNARGILREELTATCNGLLKKGQINNLYFVDFLIQ